MSETEGFDPFKQMRLAYREANRDRKRITHWRVNRAAVDAITAHPITAQDFSAKPILEREFLGIPLQLDRDDWGEELKLEPVFETYGRSTLIHDYEGPINHGNDKVRFLNAVLAAMQARKAMERAADPDPSS
jgi:hypothetical protein